jgi:hypothetical protein
MRLVLIGLVAGTMLGCGSKEAKKAGEQVNTDPALWGVWESECQANTFLDITQTVRSTEFSALGAFSKSETFYWGQDCAQDKGMTVYAAGEYEVRGAVEGQDDLTKLNLTVEESTATLHTDDAVSWANDLELCDIDDWRKDETRNILKKDCLLSLNKGDVIFDVYKVDDEKLYFGNTITFLSENDADDRPSEVQTDVVYKKQ